MAVVVLIILSTFTVIGYPLKANAASTDLSFGEAINLSKDLPQIFEADDDDHDRYSLSSSPDGQNVYVVWEDWLNNVYFRASHDTGKTFGTPSKLTDDGERGFSARLVSSGNDNVYIAWVAEFDRVHFRASHDSGDTFDPVIDLGLTSFGGPESFFERQMAASGSDVYLSWGRYGFENLAFFDGDIYFAASHDNGITFETVSLKHYDSSANGSSLSLHPIVAASDNNVYVAWEKLIRASHDNGNTFDPIVDLGSSLPGKISSIGAVASDVYVAASSASSDELLFLTSHDEGAKFNAPINFGRSSTNPQIIAVDHQSSNFGTGTNDVYVVFTSFDGQTPFIAFRASHDSGKTFDDGINLGPGHQNRMLVLGTTIYVTWRSFESEGQGISLRASHDGGASFESPIHVADPSSSFKLFPKLSGSDTDGKVNLFVGWEDSVDRIRPPTFFLPGDVFIRTGNGLSGREPATIDELLSHVSALDISKSLKKSLSIHLKQALALLNDDNPENDNNACGKLDKFIHQIDIKTEKGLTSEESQALLDEASAIKEAMGC